MGGHLIFTFSKWKWDDKPSFPVLWNAVVWRLLLCSVGKLAVIFFFFKVYLSNWSCASILLSFMLCVPLISNSLNNRTNCFSKANVYLCKGIWTPGWIFLSTPLDNQFFSSGTSSSDSVLFSSSYAGLFEVAASLWFLPNRSQIKSNTKRAHCDCFSFSSSKDFNKGLHTGALQSMWQRINLARALKPTTGECPPTHSTPAVQRNIHTVCFRESAKKNANLFL